MMQNARHLRREKYDFYAKHFLRFKDTFGSWKTGNHKNDDQMSEWHLQKVQKVNERLIGQLIRMDQRNRNVRSSWRIRMLECQPRILSTVDIVLSLENKANISRSWLKEMINHYDCFMFFVLVQIVFFASKVSCDLRHRSSYKFLSKFLKRSSNWKMNDLHLQIPLILVRSILAELFTPCICGKK